MKIAMEMKVETKMEMEMNGRKERRDILWQRAWHLLRLNSC
jgi:hypothetical protein